MTDPTDPTEPHDTPSAPRIAPIDRANATEPQATMLDKLGPAADMHLFRTLAHHPELMRSWLRFGGQLLQRSGLPAFDREVVILRTAARCGSDYEWGQHVAIGRLEGLDDATILRCAPTALASGGDWTATLIAATDQLVDDHVLDDATWAALAERYDDRQRIELTMLVGHYAMLAGMLRSAGVQTEAPMPRVGEV